MLALKTDNPTIGRNKNTSISILEMDESTYLAWRKYKLDQFRKSQSESLVEIVNPSTLTQSELDKIRQRILSNNFFIYQYQPDQGDEIKGYRYICKQLGLVDSIGNPGAHRDHVTQIEAVNTDSTDHTRHRYIPYSNKALKWHTDGYYNNPTNLVRSFVLHCVRSVNQGGENCLFDPEIAYILLRDHNPQWAAALCHSKCFTIPENVDNDERIRDQFIGAVFSTDDITGHMYTRYTERTQSIRWRSDKSTTEAVSFLRSLITDHSPWSIRVKLKPGQGIICNNILHNRSAFVDGISPSSKRCLHRIRFSNRIRTTIP